MASCWKFRQDGDEGKNDAADHYFRKGRREPSAKPAYVVQGFTVAVERLFWQGSYAYFAHLAACHGGARLGPGLVAAHSLRSEELATLKAMHMRLWRLENTGGD